MLLPATEMIELHPFSMIVVIVCLVALAGMVSRGILELRTWFGYREILRASRMLPRGLRQVVQRQQGEVIVYGNYRGRPVVSRFANSDYKPAVHLEMLAPADFELKVVPRNDAPERGPDSVVKTQNSAFDRRCAVLTNRAEDARVLLLSEEAVALLLRLCPSSNVGFCMANGKIEVSYKTIEANLAGSMLSSLQAMDKLATMAADLPGTRRVRIERFIPPTSSMLAKAAMIIAAVMGIASAFYFGPPEPSAFSTDSFKLADGAAIELHDAQLIRNLNRWKLASEDDFDPEFVASLHRAGATLTFPLRLRPVNSDEMTEKAYAFRGVDGSIRLVIIANGRLLYDARYGKLVGVARVPARSLDGVRWAEPSDNVQDIDGDGLLLVFDARDPKGAVVFVAGSRSIRSLTPATYSEISLR